MKRRRFLELKKALFRLAIGLPLLIGVILSVDSVAHAQTPALPPLEQRNYEDWFTFKYRKSYIQDPWVWGYTKEFADRFRMPEKWVEAELKGVLAVAFRMTTVGRTQCGLGGKEDNCWPALECQLDVYYDNSIKLPWNRDEIVRDFFMSGISSAEYTSVKSNLIKNYPRPGRNVIPGVGVETSLVVDGKFGGGPTSIAYYDKEFSQGVGKIGFIGAVCPSPVGIGRLVFYSHDTKLRFVNGKDTKGDRPLHTMELPSSFISRANAAYLRDDKPNLEHTNRLLQPLNDRTK